MPLPLVSVVIPTYNRSDYIVETIESVLSQEYSSLEIIVIDDGSTDGTREIVKNRFGSDVQYIWQENSERGASRNHGLRLARGELISFLDSDDLWTRDKVSCDVEILSASDAGVVYSDIDLIDADGRHLRTVKRRGRSGRVTDHLLTGNFVLIGGPYDQNGPRTADRGILRGALAFRHRRLGILDQAVDDHGFRFSAKGDDEDPHARSEHYE